MPQPVLAREALQLRQPHHVAVVGEDLAQRADRAQPGEPAQVGDRLGVPGAAQHAARHGAQREDVAGAHQVLASRVRRSASTRSVRARSKAEVPVVVPRRASTDSVNGVPNLAVLCSHHELEPERAPPRPGPSARTGCRGRA